MLKRIFIFFIIFIYFHDLFAKTKYNLQTPFPVVDLELIDNNISACDDFYKFSCGKWINKTKIPDDETSWYRFSEIDLKTEKLLTQILTNYKNGNYTPKIKYAKKLGDLYNSCMDTDQIYKDGFKNLNFLISKIESINSSKDFANATAELQRLGVDVLFAFFTEQDNTDATKIQPYLTASGIGMPEKKYYEDTTPSGVELIQKYKLHMLNSLKLSKLFTDNEAEKAADFIFEFETKLASYSLSLEDQIDPNALNNQRTFSELVNLSPTFQWDAFFNKLGLNSFTKSKTKKLNIMDLHFFEGLNIILKNTSLNDLKYYLVWKVISTNATFISKELYNEHFNFFNKILYGQKSEPERSKKCLMNVNLLLGDALGEAFIKVAFGEEQKKYVSDLSQQIIKEMREVVANSDWIDSETQLGAEKKLITLSKKIGYPNKFTNYDNLQIKSTSFFENYINGHAFSYDQMVQRIARPVDRSRWDMNPHENNAYYNPSLNEIVFPAGTLQSPLFNLLSSDAANIGATGSVIGHELTHGFDNQGREYDENGNLQNWWSPTVEFEFKKKSQCLIDQYNKYTIVDNQDPNVPKQEDNPKFHINGEVTLGENIADLGGLKLALNTYLKSNPNAFDDISEINHGYSNAQILFISYAQSWCSKSTFESLLNQVIIDEHSPSEFRVNGVVSNMPEFAKAFNCKSGQKMNPENKCSVW